MNEQAEQDLIRSAKDGDESAFGEIVRFYLPNIYSFLARMTDADAADDLAQETFVKAWKNIGRFEAGKSLRPWLLAIARNAALDHFRKRRLRAFSEFETDEGENPFVDSLSDESESLPDEQAVAKERSEEVATALRKVPTLYREVLLLRLEENLEFPEIAKVLGKPLETVRSQYRRGLDMLKKELAGGRLAP